ncbi:hypothetical protein PCASD_13584 [Puccinia coronata f. sp. avenae]|uniref:Aquaporin n=1 Tax=Puccinia coronata f. sp. avenae TaxID=200324 RepID=A0A2N5T5P2_9BASI|nr:hypothetical protein PCASD_13584 [Puccinia coronata f. sp. avenae]
MPVGNEKASETADSNTWNRPHPAQSCAAGTAGTEARGTSLDIDRREANYGSPGLTPDPTAFGRPPHRLMRLQTFSLSEINPPVSPEREQPLYSLGRPFPDSTSLRRRSPTALFGDLAAQMNLQTASLHNFPLSANRPPESRAGELAGGPGPPHGMHILRLGDLSQDQYIVATPELLRSFVEEARNRDSRRVSASFHGGDRRHSRGSQYKNTSEYCNHDDKNEMMGKQELSTSTAVEPIEKVHIPVSPKSQCSSHDNYTRGPGGNHRVRRRSIAEDPTYSSRYRRFKAIIREPAAEALASFLLAVFSGGASTQVYLTANSAISPSPKGNYATQCIGSAIGVMIGVYVAGGISGGHLNPTVTIALAVFRDFPWQKVIAYCSAQVFGGLLGALTIQLIYAGGLDVYEGGEGIRTISGPSSTAGFFLAFPAPYLSNFCSFFQQFLDSTIILLFIMAIGDRTNSPPPDGISPVIFMCVVIGVAFALGSQTSYALNPALDLSSRIVVSLMGYGTSHWSFRDQYWLWNNWVSNLLGALFGCFLYDFFLYEGNDSPLNRPWSWNISLPSFRRKKPGSEKPPPVVNGEHYV